MDRNIVKTATLFDFDWAGGSPCIYRNRLTGEELRWGDDDDCDEVPDDYDRRDWAPVEAQVWHMCCGLGNTHPGRVLAESHLYSCGEVEGCDCSNSDWGVDYIMVEEIKGRVWVVLPDDCAEEDVQFMGREDVLRALGLEKTPQAWCKPEKVA